MLRTDMPSDLYTYKTVTKDPTAALQRCMNAPCCPSNAPTICHVTPCPGNPVALGKQGSKLKYLHSGSLFGKAAICKKTTSLQMVSCQKVT